MNDRASLPVERPSYLVAAAPKAPRWAAWWYRLSCLPEPPANASLVQRELYRRARLVSLFIFLMQVFVITSLPAGFSGTNSFLAIVLVFAFIANVAAMVSNRAGLVTVAGLLVVFNVELSMGTNIITTPHGLSLAAMPLFDILVVPLVLAASLLPTGFVFLFAVLNSAFVILGMFFLPHTPDLAAALKTSMFGLISLLPTGFVFLFAVLNSAFVILGMFFLPHTPDLAAALKTSMFGLVSLPVFIQLILAVIAFFWVRGANQAIARADRAEQIALLEHEISESRRALAEQKEQLEASIQVIAQALSQANQNDTYQRIPTQANVLWEIAGPINNMIARLQRLRYTEVEHQQYQRELTMLLSALRTAQETNQPPRLPVGQGKYALTPIYQEINRIYQKKIDVSEAPPSPKKLLY